MSIAQKIVAAMLQIIPACSPEPYCGDLQEYSTYQLHEYPVDWGDNQPHATRYLCTVHWYLPNGRNPNYDKRRIARSLAEIGTYPEIINANDKDSQHYAFEFEAVEGDI